MNNDLISRSALLKKLNEMEEEYRAQLHENYDDDPFSDGILSACFTISKMIAGQSTAYDIEKVCRELLDARESNNMVDCYQAIRIVKRGGVDEV